MKKELGDYYLRDKNTSKTYYTGSTWKNNNNETFSIVGQLNIKRGGGYPWYLIRFTDGTTIPVTYPSIARKEVKNPRTPSIYGRGYEGQGPYSFYENKQEHTLFTNMFCRCYSEAYHKERPTYINCIVHINWHDFQTFCTDIQHLKGYNLWKHDTNNYQLDKDLISKDNKEYSFNNCKFVSRKENTSSAGRSNSDGRNFLAISPEGIEEVVTNRGVFSRTNSLSPSAVSACICGHRRHHKGWTFKEIKKEKK